MRNFGAILAIIGIIWGVVAFNMTTIVETEERTFGSGEYATYIPSQKVHNLDLAERRRTHLMIAGLLTVIGTVLFGFGSNRSSTTESAGRTRVCPFCAESIRIEAVLCKHCGKDVPTQKVELPIKDQDPAVSMKICSSCNSTNEAENMNCWKCHSQLA